MCFKKKKSAPPQPKVEEPKTPVVTTPVSPTGTTSVTPATVVKEPDKAAEEQERLAAEELRQKRIERARSKQSLLRKRLERTQEYGSGKKVLTGNERDLGAMASSSLITPSTGKRRGAGRRSLLTGSTGGIGFYSRYL
jgi:hypothetical protein